MIIKKKTETSCAPLTLEKTLVYLVLKATCSRDPSWKYHLVSEYGTRQTQSDYFEPIITLDVS